jgi:hypothetical protein
VRHRGGLAEPVPFDEAASRHLLEVALHLRGKAGGAADALGDRLEVGLPGLDLWVLGQGRVEGGHSREHRRVMLPYDLEQPAEIPGVGDDHLHVPAIDGMVHANGHRVGVGEGKCGEHDFLALFEPDRPRLRLAAVGYKVGVGEHGRLWNPGGASGVHEDRFRLGRRRGDDVSEPVSVGVPRDVHSMAVLLLLGNGEQHLQDPGEVLLDVGDDHMLQIGLGARLPHTRVGHAQTDGDGGARVVRLVSELCRRVERICRDGHAAGTPDGLVGDDRLRAIGHEDRDPVALLQTQLLQPGSQPICQGVQLRVSDPLVEEDQGALVRVAPCRPRKDLRQSDPRVVEGRRDSRVVVLVPGPGLHARLLAAPRGGGRAMLTI